MSAKKTAATESATSIESAVSAGKETFEQISKIGTESARQNIDQAVAMAKDNMEKTSETLFKGYDQMTALAQGNFEAVSKSFGILSKGVEDVSKAWVSYTQGTVDYSVTIGKQVLGAKSVNEVVDLQNTFTKTVFDSFVAETTKISELSVKTANEAIEPIKARVDETVVTLTRPLAA